MVSYRYGFNGMEKDDEVKGAGNAYDFGGRSIYDGRVARFVSIDPRWSDYPFMSSYCFAANNPISFIDEEGNGPIYVSGPTAFAGTLYSAEKYNEIMDKIYARILDIHYIHYNKKSLKYEFDYERAKKDFGTDDPYELDDIRKQVGTDEALMKYDVDFFNSQNKKWREFLELEKRWGHMQFKKYMQGLAEKDMKTKLAEYKKTY